MADYRSLETDKRDVDGQTDTTITILKVCRDLSAAPL